MAANWTKDIRFFVTSLGIMFFCDILAGVYFRSALTTIERRFELSTTRVALLTSAYQIGNLSLQVFISHYGSRSHRPRIIAIGSTLVAFGYLISSLPQFLGDRYQYIDAYKNASTSIDREVSMCTQSDKNVSAITCNQGELDSRESGNNLFILIIVGSLISGIGAAPLQPLGISYIDDSADKKKSPVYVGVVMTIALIGPTFGFLLGSALLRIWVDVGWVDPSAILITPKNPSWVGAWWLGSILCGILILITAIPMYFFPRKMESLIKTISTMPEYPFSQSNTLELKKKEVENENTSSEKGGMLQATKRVLSNPVFVLLVFNWIFGGFNVVGVITFFPKYLEVQFGASAAQANMYYGAIGIPCLAVGTMLGSFIMKSLNPSQLGIARLMLIPRVLAAVLAIGFLFIGCETIDIAGATVPYSSSAQNSGISVIDTCNAQCNCQEGAYSPICGADGITYLSPCHAGCHGTYSAIEGKIQNYTECSCINPSEENAQTHWAYPESCQSSNCRHLILLVLALTAAVSLIGGIGATPSYVFLMRTVSQKDKALAIGLAFMATRVLAWIPGPILFGKVIDSACLYSTAGTCGGKGYCRVYDNNALRFRYYSLLVIAEILSAITVIVIYRITRKNHNKGSGKADYTAVGSIEDKTLLGEPCSSMRVGTRLASTNSSSEDHLDEEEGV